MSNWVEPQWWQIDLLCCSHWSALNCCPTICDTYNVKQSYMITWCIWLMLIWYHNMLCRMDIHNFPSMPSEPNSTAACRFSSWNIMGHSHSLVEKCWKRFGAFKTLLPVPVEAENSTFRWASLEMCWNVLNQKDPTMNICLFFLHVFIRKIYHNERLLIKFRCSHPM